MANIARMTGRILVVDDNMANRELLAQDLDDEGFEVELAESGRECLRKTSEFKPDVILLDINMPGMSGIETCRELRKMDSGKLVPVVFITASTGDEIAVEALEAGGNDFLNKPYSHSILLARVRTQIASFRAHEELRRMAITDHLTGLFSRRYLYEEMRRSVKSTFRARVLCVSVLLIDIDHFKKINDTLGHLEGDRVLKRVAEMVQQTLRETDVTARFGGEEFVAVLPDTDHQTALEAAKRLRCRIEELCAPATVSIGVSSLWDTEEMAKGVNLDDLVADLLRRADLAMYAAKNRGRNQVVSEGEL